VRVYASRGQDISTTRKTGIGRGKRISTSDPWSRTRCSALPSKNSKTIGNAHRLKPCQRLGDVLSGAKSLGREVAKPEKCPRKRAMQLKKCMTSRSRAMLAIAFFIATYPTSRIMSQKPTSARSVSDPWPAPACIRLGRCFRVTRLCSATTSVFRKIMHQCRPDSDVESNGCQCGAFNPASYLGERGIPRGRGTIGEGRESAIIRRSECLDRNELYGFKQRSRTCSGVSTARLIGSVAPTNTVWPGLRSSRILASTVLRSGSLAS
jgi:hypothetical protein